MLSHRHIADCKRVAVDWAKGPGTMSDHDAEVAAVLAEAMYDDYHAKDSCQYWMNDDAVRTLAVLTAAGYAVVKLPPGVEVEHGARLVGPYQIEALADDNLFTIDPPERQES